MEDLKRAGIFIIKSVIGTVVTIISISLIVNSIGPKSHAPVVTRGEYGTVERVSNCKAGKYSYRCSVDTNLNSYYMNLANFPDNSVIIGDILFLQKENFGTRVEISTCKNNLCSNTGVCFWWMPCFSR